MPVFDFRCKECGAVFERSLSAGASKEGVECPNCQGRQTQRLYSSFAIGKQGRTPPIGQPCPRGGR